MSRLSLRRRRIPALATTAGLALAGLGVLGAAPASALAPANDDIASAVPLTLNTPVLGTNDDGTVEAAEMRCGGGIAVATVWYAYTAATATTVTFQTDSIGDNVDTNLTVYTGPAAAAIGDLTYEDCSDDAFELLSSRAIDVVAGTIYYLQVDAYDAATPKGGWTLSATVPGVATPQTNDDLATAARLIPFIPVTPDTRLATTETDEPDQACAAPVHNSVWYHYTPVVNRTTSFPTAGATGSVVNVWSGPPNATAAQLTAVACDSSVGGDVRVTVPLVGGTEYYLQVGTPAAGGTTPFTFGVDQYTWTQPSKVVGSGTAAGQSVSLTATVAADPYAGDLPLPTLAGTVELLEDGASIGSTPLTGPTASFAVANATPGTHRYLLLFIADSADFKDAFRYVTVVVPPKANATVASSRATVKARRSVTLKGHRTPSGRLVVEAKRVKVRATVTAAGAPATGTVVFRVGKKTVTRTLTNGVAKVKIAIRKTTKVRYTYTGSATAQPVTGTFRIKAKVKVVAQG